MNRTENNEYLHMQKIKTFKPAVQPLFAYYTYLSYTTQNFCLGWSFQTFVTNYNIK